LNTNGQNHPFFQHTGGVIIKTLPLPLTPLVYWTIGKMIMQRLQRQQLGEMGENYASRGD